MELANANHVYELRMYQVNDGKMDALIARFGDHTDAILQAAQYEEHWLLASAGRAVLQNLFVYILEHPNREEAKKNWTAFQADPEWKKVKADSEAAAGGPLAKRMDSCFMDPTSFSALK
jgi:hypothetical protein